MTTQAARELCPLMVQIGLVGRLAGYPAFNNLQVVQQSGLDWAYYVDQQGEGWAYDKCCGHKTAAPDSPYGTQYGVLLVPRAFADQAIAAFPGACSIIDEPTLERFWEAHVTSLETEELIDQTVLAGISGKQAVGGTLTAQQEAALDPTDPTPGIRPNTRKKWATHKADRGLKIV